MTDAVTPATGENHIWQTLGWYVLEARPESTRVGWDATADYCFPTTNGYVLQGGLVTALLDVAMGGACWNSLDEDQDFLTADVHVQFLRPTRPGEIISTGSVVRRSRRAVFCSAELHDASGVLLAAARGTQILMPASEAGRRTWPFGHSGT